MTQTDQKSINRRKFLLITGGALGAAAITCLSVPVAATSTGKKAPAPFPLDENSYGDGKGKKVLVAYASAAGSTAGVADAIGKQLAESGASVEVRKMTSVASLAGYSAVVLGSAIHGGAWLPEAMDFVRTHQAELQKLSVAIFQVSMMAASSTPQNQAFVATFLEPVRQLIPSVSEGRFAGALYPSRHSFFEGFGLRIFLMYVKLKEGDYRDWKAINAWAQEIYGLLLPK